ncbi:MAG: NifU family protein, partial [Bacteroidetes bacterium]|nr:NifU family protein [Bacteroidota bacterium]
GKLAEENQTQEEIEDSAIVSEIKKLLASHVRPAVAADGGDIIYESFDEDDGILRLRLQGSCSGCPSSTITLKAGIEGLMTRMVPAVKSVEAV